MGAERGVNCEHMQALMTNIFQRHWEWQEDRRVDLQPGSLASLDAKTAFDVAKTPCGISDTHLDGCPRTPDGRSVGRDARRPSPRALRTVTLYLGTLGRQ